MTYGDSTRRQGEVCGGRPGNGTGKTRRIGITPRARLPGLSAIRGVGKAAKGEYGIEVLGIYDGFAGLIERWRRLSLDDLSGLLTQGGTMLRTSRNPRYERADGQIVDMTGRLTGTAPWASTAWSAWAGRHAA